MKFTDFRFFYMSQNSDVTLSRLKNFGLTFVRKKKIISKEIIKNSIQKYLNFILKNSILHLFVDNIFRNRKIFFFAELIQNLLLEELFHSQFLKKNFNFSKNHLKNSKSHIKNIKHLLQNNKMKKIYPTNHTNGLILMTSYSSIKSLKSDTETGVKSLMMMESGPIMQKLLKILKIIIILIIKFPLGFIFSKNQMLILIETIRRQTKKKHRSGQKKL